jgi:hypothetical protein
MKPMATRVPLEGLPPLQFKPLGSIFKIPGWMIAQWLQTAVRFCENLHPSAEYPRFSSSLRF